MEFDDHRLLRKRARNFFPVNDQESSSLNATVMEPKQRQQEQQQQRPQQPQQHQQQQQLQRQQLQQQLLLQQNQELYQATTDGANRLLSTEHRNPFKKIPIPQERVARSSRTDLSSHSTTNNYT